MNDSMGDEYGCSFEQVGIVKIPFYVKNHFYYIKNKLEKKIALDSEHSHLVILKIKEICCDKK
jgi:hypothetical protein